MISFACKVISDESRNYISVLYCEGRDTNDGDNNSGNTNRIKSMVYFRSTNRLEKQKQRSMLEKDFYMSQPQPRIPN